MTRYGLVCLLLGTLAWGQAANSKPAPAAQAPVASRSAAPAATAPPANPAPPQEPDVSKIPPDAPVITIAGLCEHPSADKTAGPACKTVITRAEFEKLVEAVQPTMPARVRRQFATRYASALVMSKKAEEMGLDKGPNFEEHMQLARIQILAQLLSKAIQEKASQIPDKDIEEYYKSSLDKFEEADLDRIYVPKNQQPPAAAAGEKKLSEEEEEKHRQASEQTMKAAADKLRARAVAGEDFAKLQAEAYQVAGIKSSAPTTSMGKMRRSVLPPTQASVMDLKPGEISAVISDPNGYFIYKLKSKETMSLDQAREEIKGTLRSQRVQDEMRAAQEAGTPTLEEAYFGPEGPARGPMLPGPGATPPGKPAPPPAPK